MGWVTVAALLVGHAAVGSAASAGEGEGIAPFRRVAYLLLLGGNNARWIGPRHADGSIDTSIIDDVLAERPGFARPEYVRITTAFRMCEGVDDPNCATGVPPVGSPEYEALARLKEAGLKLGVAINVYRKPRPPKGCGEGLVDPTEANSCIRPVEEVVAHAQAIRATGFYDFIFLDFSPLRTPTGGEAGLDDLQQIVDGVRQAGWDLVFTNDTGHDQAGVLDDSAHGVWAHAKWFDVFQGRNWREQVSQALAGGGSPIRPRDLAFIEFVHRNRPGSFAVLKFEIPGQINRLSELTSEEQNKILEALAEGQGVYGYRMIYPLYIGSAGYDSRTEGTFWTQRALMEREH